MRIRPLGAALCLLLFSCALACVTNPVTGRRELSVLSVEQEIAAGRQAAEQVAAQIGLIDAPELTAYVSAIGQRLARVSPRRDVEYRFAIADMAEPNAFALPGGWIYVSRGLLALANSEAELANVIGHEIGHVAARHAAQRETRSVLVGLGTLAGIVAAGAAGGTTAAEGAAQFGQLLGAGLIASYGRDQERQADEIGQKLAADVGWSPSAMTRFLSTLERWSVLKTGEARLPTFLDSHPLTGERVQTTARRASTLAVQPAPPIAASHARFLAYLEGLVVGPDPAEGVFQNGLFLHPVLALALEFPKQWEKQNQKAAVAARPHERDALIALEGQGPTGDPREAARVFVQKSRVEVLASDATTIGGFRAFRVLARGQSDSGALGLHLTWIAHPEGMFRITGLSPVARYERYAAVFDRVVASFRTPTSVELRGIRERRLRVVAARGDESLAELSRRTANVWALEETLAVNAFSPDALLQSGQPVKIAVEVPYRPRS